MIPFVRSCAAAVLLGLGASLAADVTLPALISDNMLLQAGVATEIWGKAAPGEEVEVSFAGQSEKSTANQSGSWKVMLKPMAASSENRTLAVKGKNAIEVKNVLVGEVWLGSGQSNMGMIVASATNSKQEIANANFPQIRLFSVPYNISSRPNDSCEGRWQICSPSTAASFSATLFFFGRDLHKQLKAPVGLVSSAMGGTGIQSWLPLSVTSAHPEYGKQADLPAADKYPSLKTYNSYRESIYAPLLFKDAGNKGASEGWQNASCDTSSWIKAKLFQPLEKALGSDIDGVIWTRREIKLPKDWEGKDFALSIDLLNDGMDLYFNGEKISSAEVSLLSNRWPKVNVPGRLVKSEGNLIAIRFMNALGPAGVRGILAENGTTKINLSGEWLCKVEQSHPALNMPKLTPPTEIASALCNAMISPLKNYKFKGALWYQGEHNSRPVESELYASMLKSLISSWRADFNSPSLYFLTVQLPNYGQLCTQPNENSQWALVRESQGKSLSMPMTGMVVTTDIGDEQNIHPQNKQDVGRRLALLARSLCYGEKSLEAYGPVFESMTADGGTLKLKFSHTTGGLAAKAGPLKGFAIAAADGEFVWADARIEGDCVLVSNANIKEPAMVRYNWANSPFGNLYNGAGLPAAPFRASK